MIFYLDNQFGEFQNLTVSQFLFLAFVLGNVLPFVSAFFGFSINASFLAGDVFIYYSSGFFLNNIRVGGDLAGNDGFAQAVAGFYDQLIAVLSDGVDGKSDAGDLGFYHLLNDHGDGDFAVMQTFLKPVEDGSGGEQRRPAFLNIGQESFFGGVEKTVQLSGPSG